MTDTRPQSSTTRPGWLHFDVTLGCTAEVLTGALAELVGDMTPVSEGMAEVGLPESLATLAHESRKNLSGARIDFALGQDIATFAQPKYRAKKRQPFWARSKNQNTQRDPAPQIDGTILFSSWLRGESATLAELEQMLDESALVEPAYTLAQKVIGLLKTSLDQALGKNSDEATLGGPDVARMFCEIVAFTKLITALDPLEVSATRVAFSTPPRDQNTLDRHDPAWLLALSEDVPTLDKQWPAPFSDVLGLAFLRAVCSRFGARGESTLQRFSTGLSSTLKQPILSAKALWCVPPALASRPDYGETKADFLPLVELCAVVEHGSDNGELIRRLAGLGVKRVQTWQVFEGSSFPRLMLRGLVSFADRDPAIEALLVTGGASEVATQVIEAQRLQSRVVSVPYGQGQKAQSCRVTEWIWGGKTLRADPDPGDLTAIVKATGFAQEVVRADVLTAWRKWRQA